MNGRSWCTSLRPRNRRADYEGQSRRQDHHLWPDVRGGVAGVVGIEDDVVSGVIVPSDQDGIYGAAVAPVTSHGHPRQAHRPRLAVAERLRRAIDRIDPT